MSTPCIICQNSENNQFIKLKELQLGLGEEFDYQLCGSCGSLQILNPPSDFTPYYPNENYYSFTEGITELKSPDYLRRAKAEYLLYGRNKMLGSILSIGYKIPEFYEWMLHTHAGLDDAILDVGCGNGMLLGKLHRMGFTNLKGIDPFINEERDLGAVKIFKKDIFEMSGKFDVIMMHHALEHMSDPLAAMKKAHAMLNDGKYLLVRIPIMGHYGWKTYGGHWAGLDAPRHLFIPTEEGMRILAKKAGFKLERLDYDTVDYLIWASEQYKKGMPLYAPGSHMIDRKNSSFTKKIISGYRRILAEINAHNFGDTAAFYLVKS